MKLLAHRGFWKTLEEQNTPVAFLRAVENGFGIETDIRDCLGTVRISHDPPNGGEQKIDEFFSLINDVGKTAVTIALNIKSDGLAKTLKPTLDKYTHHDSFVFDMSVPDMRLYFAQATPVFARLSEVETIASWQEKSKGIWLDQFDGLWFNNNLIDNLLNQGKFVCIVSSELHKRDYDQLWQMLKKYSGDSRVLLCTDFPDKAKNYFGLP